MTANLSLQRTAALRAPADELPASDWADWDANGDLLFARDGRIYRERELIALRDMRFEEIPPPASATQWLG